jgi:pantothenate kinase
MPEKSTATLDELIDRAWRLVTPGERRILGITGPPGAGKSTAAAAVAEALGEDAVLVPMDGFHLADGELRRLGRRDRKGAADTFDAAGFAALLRRLRDQGEPAVYAPAFRRDIEEPIAGAISVPASVPLVVTEGNYLLAEGPWAPVRALLDEVWFLDTEEPLRLDRLIRRHEQFGKPPAAALAWATGSDQRNADLIGRTRARADLIVRIVTDGLSSVTVS